MDIVLITQISATVSIGASKLFVFGAEGMIEATFVLYARKAQLARLRAFLRSHVTDAVRWKERRRLFGSEFYVSGPVGDARIAHEAAQRDLMLFDRPG